MLLFPSDIHHVFHFSVVSLSHRFDRRANIVIHLRVGTLDARFYESHAAGRISIALCVIHHLTESVQ